MTFPSGTTLLMVLICSMQCTQDMTIYVKCSSLDLFLKSVDEFTGIDFLAELNKDEKMYIDGESRSFTVNLTLIICN